MSGWLIVNSFIDSKKFRELYDYLKNAAARNGITLAIKTTDSLICDIESDLIGLERPDFVLFWDKDIYMAKRLEEEGIRLYNSARAIEICDNKILTGLCLKNIVPIPKTVIAPKTFEGINYNKKIFLYSAAEILGLPMIIKEAYGSFGHQVYLANDCEDAARIIDGLGHKEFLMQEYISTSRGRDIRVNVVGSEVVSAMLRYNDDDFRSNISSGGRMKPITITSRQAQIAVKAVQAIGLDYAGVDLLFGNDGEPIVCEVNSNPHFKSSYECTGVDMSVKIMEHIKRCML